MIFCFIITGISILEFSVFGYEPMQTMCEHVMSPRGKDTQTVLKLGYEPMQTGYEPMQTDYEPTRTDTLTKSQIFSLR